MRYTHYWYRKETEVPYKTMRELIDDFRKLIPEFEKLGIKLAGGFGEGEPEVMIDGVWFNGLEKCGHAERDLGITWPSPTASGVKEDGDTNGTWFAGALLETRTCGGDCSHETVHFPRVLGKEDSHQAEGGFFSCCKTAYKPYDVAVTAFLILAKHHMGDKIDVHSDGEDKDWQDGLRIVQRVLGHPDGILAFTEDGNLTIESSEHIPY